ncbi:MAG: hypothetical protein ACRCW1_00650 [Anaerotignaceae bacterium]
MENEKVAFPLRMEKDTQQMLKAIYKQDNCNSQNEFIEKAIKFYISYITTENHSSYLNPAIYNAIKSAIKESESRTANNLFRLAVEMSVTMNILAEGMEIPIQHIKDIRSRCIDTVKSQRGKYIFEDAMIDANK